MELVSDLARIYHLDGDHNKVIALYEDSYKAHPDSAVAINNLASYLSDYADSPANLERAAKLAEPLLKSNNASLMDTVAWIAYKQGSYDKAKEIMLKLIDLDPAMAVSHYHLGMLYFKQIDNAKAAEHLQKAVDAKTPFDGLDVAKETLKKVQGGA